MSKALRPVIKRAGAFALSRAGALSPKRWADNQSWRILMFHRVTTPETAEYPLQAGMFVSPETFAMQMRFLKEHAEVIPLESLVRAAASGKAVHRGTVAITFDDGWADNYHHALPVLQDLKLPATIFLATAYINSAKLFWSDEIAFALHALRSESRQQASIEARLANHDDISSQDKSRLIGLIKQPIERRDGRPALGPLGDADERLIADLKARPPEQRYRLVQVASELAKEYATINLPGQFLSWDQVEEMARSGITFGNHSHNHKPFAELSAPQMSDELENARQLMRAHGLAPSPVFCYPYGSHSEESQQLLAAKGFEFALTTETVSHLSWSPRLFGRVNIHEDACGTNELFALHLRRAG